MPPRPEDDTGSLEKARKRLYDSAAPLSSRSPLPTKDVRSLPHRWEGVLLDPIPPPGKHHVRLASLFLGAALIFFIIALSAAGYFFYFGGNSVSIEKIVIDVQGPTTIAGGDIVPLSLSITNRNPVDAEDASIEIAFPSGTLRADGSLTPYPRYTENLGTVKSGETITRSIKAIVFGGAGQVVMLPISFSYGTKGSSTTFIKKSSYPLVIASTPLSISIEALSETVSGKPLTFTLTVRSNANVPLDNVVVSPVFPFGFSVSDSSVPLTSANFFLGTLQPAASKTILLTGTLTGQNGEQRVFHFTVGTAKSAADPTPTLPYMTQDHSVAITAPFITAALSINGDTRSDLVVSPGVLQNASVSYTNTLSTNIADATVAITLSGSGVDYGSIETANGFYRSSDRTIVFSKDTDPSLALLAPGASGVGSFSFSTVSADALSSPSITFSISVSGTRIGQTDVPEKIQASMTKTVKVSTAVALSATASHSSGPLGNSGPVPPVAGQATTYTVAWNVKSGGSAVADGVVTAVLPSYVSYTGKTSGAGFFTYDEKSRTVSWDVGNVAQGASVQGYFQISLTPSTSQEGSAPVLTGPATFSGHDRFAGIRVSATANPVTTETPGDPGYSSGDGTVR